jgi:hypothetical protein
MKKLSRIELDVVVNEVVNSIKLIEDNKSKELFENSENKDLFLSKINEIKELEDKFDLLREEVREIENKFDEDDIRVFYINKNNRNFNDKGKLFSISLKDNKGNSFSLYKDIEKEIILSSLEDMNIKELIKDLVEKFK